MAGTAQARSFPHFAKTDGLSEPPPARVALAEPGHRYRDRGIDGEHIHPTDSEIGITMF